MCATPIFPINFTGKPNPSGILKLILRTLYKITRVLLRRGSCARTFHGSIRFSRARTMYVIFMRFYFPSPHHPITVLHYVSYGPILSCGAFSIFAIRPTEFHYPSPPPPSGFSVWSFKLYNLLLLFNSIQFSIVRIYNHNSNAFVQLVSIFRKRRNEYDRFSPMIFYDSI